MAEWQQVKEILQSALEIAPKNRAAFLDRVCADDKSLRLEVESLIASSKNAGSFMEQAAIGNIVKMFDGTEHDGQISRRFNHYEIIKQIGAGGMGEVYLAQDTKLDRKVAVKILNQRFAVHESNIQRFVKEAKAAICFESSEYSRYSRNRPNRKERSISLANLSKEKPCAN